MIIRPGLNIILRRQNAIEYFHCSHRGGQLGALEDHLARTKWPLKVLDGLFLKGRARDLYLMLSRQRSCFNRIRHSADPYFEHTWVRLSDEVVDKRAR